MSKKNMIMYIIGFAILVSASIFIYYSTSEKNETKIIKMYSYIVNDIKYYTFNKDDVMDNNFEIRTFKCQSNNCEGVSITDNYAIIKDDQKTYLYDISTTRTLLNNTIIDKIEVIKDNQENNKGLLLTSNERIGYFNLDITKLTIPIEYDYIDNTIINNNSIIVKKENKVGIINIKNNQIIFDIINDNIQITDSSSLIITNNHLDKLYDYNSNVLLNNQEFNTIYFASNWKNIVYLRENNSIMVYEKDGTLITEIGTITDDYDYIQQFAGQYAIELKFQSKTTGEEINFYYNPETQKTQKGFFPE